jgi:hypothetical protein
VEGDDIFSASDYKCKSIDTLIADSQSQYAYQRIFLSQQQIKNRAGLAALHGMSFRYSAFMESRAA